MKTLWKHVSDALLRLAFWGGLTILCWHAAAPLAWTWLSGGQVKALLIVLVIVGVLSFGKAVRDILELEKLKKEGK